MTPRLAPVVPPLLAIVVFLAWSVDRGGYPTKQLLAGGTILALLLVIAAVALHGFAVRAVVAGAVGALGAYGLLSLASIAWAEVRGDAWEGGNRAIVYAVVFALFALTPWTALSGTLVVGAAAGGVAAVGLLVVGSAAAAAEPESYFVFRRFAEPTGYPNATAALYLAPMFGALVLASRSGLARWARAGLLGTAGTLLGLGLLPQSRASLGALAVTLLVLLVVAREPLRILLAAVLLAAATVPFAGRYLSVDLYDRETTAELADRLADARNALTITFLLLLAAGLAWAWVDAHRPIPAQVVERVGRGLALGAALLAVTGLAGAFVFADASGRIGDAWSEFTAESEPTSPSATSHLDDPLAGGNRYDLWRVALGQFEDAPLLGAGSDNFEADFLRERRSIDEPRHPHGLPFRVLGQTGILGAALLLAFVGLACYAAIAGARRLDRPEEAGVALAGLGAFTYWFVHGTVDWFWEYPALTGIALASLALAAAIGPPAAAAPTHRRVLAAGAAVAGVLVAVLLLPPLLSEREVTRAGDTWRDDPAEALDALALARDLNPLSAQPDVLAGAIAGRSGRRAEAREAFARALERNPASWYSLLELAVLEYQDDDTAAALVNLRRARALNPRDQILREVERVMRADERMTLGELDGLFSRQLARLEGDPS